MIKLTGNQSVVIPLFKKPMDHKNGYDLSQRGSSSNNNLKWRHKDEHEINVGCKIVKPIVYEMETRKANGIPNLITCGSFGRNIGRRAKEWANH